MYGGGTAGSIWQELAVVPVHGRLPDPVACLSFDPAYEALWVGTAGGWLVRLQSPELQRLVSFRGHAGVGGCAALACLPDGVASCGAGTVCYHAHEGVGYWQHREELQAEFTCLLPDPSSAGSKLLVGRHAGGLLQLSTATGQALGCQLEGEGVQALAAHGARGPLAVGTAGGRLLITDPRAGFKVEHSLAAHPTGLASLDVRGDLVATCGYSSRQGRQFLEAHVKVFDLRAGARLLGSVPFHPAPQRALFHPKFTSTLLLAAGSGTIGLADVSGALGGAQQVDLEGDALTAIALSSTGEAVALGGSGGYVHLLSRSSGTPRINEYSQPLEPLPPAYSPPAVALSEGDPLSSAPTFAPPLPGERPLSALAAGMIISAGQPPRVVDAELLAGMRQVDWVGYINNPYYVRGAPKGQATRAAAKLRNQRQRPMGRADSAVKASRARKRLEAGGCVLPSKYKRVAVRVKANARPYDTFNFTAFNRTRYAGLENDMPNAYANSLLQVLAFQPELAAAALRQPAMPDQEFSLRCELAFLFRMLRNANGAACRASNFLRALRQSREAAALGVIEGRGITNLRATTASDIEVEANKDKQLAQRVQRLSNFLLEQLHKQAQAVGEESVIDRVFGLRTRQTMQLASGSKAPQTREATSFQVLLQYPPASERPRPGSSPGQPPCHAPLPAGGRPSFADVLTRTLQQRDSMRAWFDEEVGYALVTTRRYPLRLPPTLAIGCGLQDRADLVWWSPYPPDAEGRPPRPWLPPALRVEVDTQQGTVTVVEGPSAEALHALDGGDADSAGAAPAAGSSDEAAAPVVYELVAVVAHVWDEDELGPPPLQAGGRGAGDEAEGHLVAHVKIPATTLHQPSRSSSFSGILSPRNLSFSKGPPPAEALAASPLSRGVSFNALLADTSAVDGTNEGRNGGEIGGTEAEEAAAAAGSRDGGPAATTALVAGGDSSPAVPAGAALVQAEGGGPSDGGRGEGMGGESGLDGADTLQSRSGAAGGPDGGAEEAVGGAVAAAVAGAGAHVGSTGAAAALDGAAAGPPARVASGGGPRNEWLVLNDFSVVPAPPADALQLYGGQKVPCLLFYSQVPRVRPPPAALPPPPPVVSAETFLAVCRQPPLQGSESWTRRTFTPFEPDELPDPGSLFGLDAEFVAMSAPEKAIASRGQSLDVETRPSRLCVARISVVRGQGPRQGVAAIDDYIRMVEPVHDYLTKFSGLEVGDLDPLRSPHFLTTLKAAYCKLQFLIDGGAVFVGHGLRNDFRLINLVVPPQQVVDTVQLFHLQGQRFLSLRFLAGYLLRQEIQGDSHDSIVDARTAVQLYQVHQQLVAEGRLQETLLAMYRWGNEHGFASIAPAAERNGAANSGEG